MTVVVAGNKPACVKCLRRPKRWSGNRWQSYCAICQAEYARMRRSGKVEMLLTYEEARLIDEYRAGPASKGRHAAAVA